MGKYKEDAQDDILRQMDKLNRRSDRKAEDLSLEAQLKILKMKEKMTPEQRRAAAPFRDWKDALHRFIVDEKKICTTKIFSTICSKYENSVKEFHTKGSPFSDTVTFFESKSIQLSNIF